MGKVSFPEQKDSGLVGTGSWWAPETRTSTCSLFWLRSQSHKSLWHRTKFIQVWGKTDEALGTYIFRSMLPITSGYLRAFFTAIQYPCPLFRLLPFLSSLYLLLAFSLLFFSFINPVCSLLYYLDQFSFFEHEISRLIHVGVNPHSSTLGPPMPINIHISIRGHLWTRPCIFPWLQLYSCIFSSNSSSLIYCRGYLRL